MQGDEATKSNTGGAVRLIDDPAARELVREAHSRMYKWPAGFGGYRADLILNDEGRITDGTVRLIPRKDTTVDLLGAVRVDDDIPSSGRDGDMPVRAEGGCRRQRKGCCGREPDDGIVVSLDREVIGRLGGIDHCPIHAEVGPRCTSIRCASPAHNDRSRQVEIAGDIRYKFIELCA